MIHFLVDMKHHDHKIVLLYRFHLVVIVINFIAFIIDMSTKRYSNVAIELAVSILLLLSLWYLRSKQKLKQSVYIFIAIVSIGLFTLIYLNHFATMSIVFILLLPLMTLLFLELKESLFISALLFAIMAILFYIESLNNPLNPLIQNPQAIFNLTYAALIVYVFGLLYHFSILRTFKELDSANRQKALLLKEVHHRTKNNMQIIISLLDIQIITY